MIYTCAYIFHFSYFARIVIFDHNKNAAINISVGSSLLFVGSIWFYFFFALVQSGNSKSFFRIFSRFDECSWIEPSGKCRTRHPFNWRAIILFFFTRLTFSLCWIIFHLCTLILVRGFAFNSDRLLFSFPSLNKRLDNSQYTEDRAAWPNNSIRFMRVPKFSYEICTPIGLLQSTKKNFSSTWNSSDCKTLTIAFFPAYMNFTSRNKGIECCCYFFDLKMAFLKHLNGKAWNGLLISLQRFLMFCREFSVCVCVFVRDYSFCCISIIFPSDF